MSSGGGGSSQPYGWEKLIKGGSLGAWKQFQVF